MKKPITSAKETSPKNRSDWSDFFNLEAAMLTLADGTRFPGLVPESQLGRAHGEVVFNTGMTGYTETLTDPSYAGQILVFTAPIMGNYGVSAPDAWESDAVQVAGVVVNELTLGWSHATGKESLAEWLARYNVPLITGVDTRALTKHLRASGTMIGTISRSGQRPPADARATTPKVSIMQPQIYNPGQDKLIIAVDCGMKQNILRSLTSLPACIKRVPHDYDYTDEPYDAVVVSNGPGDPTDYPETIAILRTALAGNRPIFGICLGTQLMALAAGARTYKLPYGHRGHNQPVITPDGHGFITSQNHGFAIEEASLPAGWKVTFRNLNDNSVEGIAHTSKPFSSVQFHPEASPGPTDTAWLFKDFGDLL